MNDSLENLIHVNKSTNLIESASNAGNNFLST